MSTLLVSEFSPNGKLFAQISSDGKLKIWDTETSALKQEYTPNLHLNSPCTSLAWIPINVNKNKKQKKSRKSVDQGEGSLYIALGTNKGGVALFSYALGKIESNLIGDGHSGAITAISYDKSNCLYTCGEDARVIVWSFSLGKQISSWNVSPDRPTCLLAVPDSTTIVVGSRQIKYWSAESLECEHEFIGHSSNVTLMKHVSSASNEYFLSASKMDRVLSLWRVKSGGKSKKTAIATFLMEDVAFFMNAKVEDQDGDDVLNIVAVTRSGLVHFYSEIIKNLKSEKPVKPKVTIEIASNSSDMVEPIPTVAASLDFPNQDRELLLGFGDRNFLRFENIQIDTTDKRQVLIRNDPKKLNKKTPQLKDNKTVTAIVDNDAEYQTPSTIPRKIRSAEIPMETRLENLSVSTGTMPQGRNKAQLLVQGLHSKDAEILRLVFQTDDEKTIRTTLQRIPPKYIPALVAQLTGLAQKKTADVQNATVWLKILIETHASQLMALGKNDLLMRFGPLMGVIEHRANTVKALSRVSGRLRLLINQIKLNRDSDDMIDNENVLVYEDEDSSSDNEDLVQMNGASSSDDQWEEDEVDDDEDDDADSKMEVSDDDEDT